MPSGLGRLGWPGHQPIPQPRSAREDRRSRRLYRAKIQPFRTICPAADQSLDRVTCRFTGKQASKPLPRHNRTNCARSHALGRAGQIFIVKKKPFSEENGSGQETTVTC